MIHSHKFIDAHFQHSTSGLLLQFLGSYPIFISMREGGIEISKFNYKVGEVAWASSNGLILDWGVNLPGYYITNPTTEQWFDLPPLTEYIIEPSLAGIAYAAASMEYKVVYAVIDSTQEFIALGCAILAVGVDDSWRNVCNGHLSCMVKALFVSPPSTTEGFIHWAGNSPEVLTLNVETETITETPVPCPHVDGERKHDYYFMSTGRFLSLLVDCGDFMWEVWEMKPESGEWRRLPNINLEAHKCRFEELGGANDRPMKPVGWLEYPEVLLFGMKNYKPQACLLHRLQTWYPRT